MKRIGRLLIVLLLVCTALLLTAAADEATGLPDDEILAQPQPEEEILADGPEEDEISADGPEESEILADGPDAPVAPDASAHFGSSPNFGAGDGFIQGMCGGDGEVHWELTSDTLRIYGHGNMKDYTSWRGTPWYPYDAYESVKHIIVEDGITAVGAYAFAYFYYVEDISLGKDLMRIGQYAFYEVTYYTEKDVTLVIPASVYEIGEKAFAYALWLKEVYILWDYTSLPEYVPGWGITGLDIRYRAFYDCEKLGILQLGNFKRNAQKTIRIGQETFAYCPVLNEVRFSDSLASVADGAFYKCDGIWFVDYYGEEKSIPRSEISQQKNETLLRVLDGQYGNRQIRKQLDANYQSNDTDHWYDVFWLKNGGLYQKTEPHSFVKTIGDEYRTDDNEMIFYEHCEVCGHVGPGTFSRAEAPADTDIFMTTETTKLTGGIYIVNRQLDFGSTRLEIEGDVSLLLCDGCGITTSGGIHVCPHKTLTVYSESIDLSETNGMGYIKVTGSPSECAGIGGNRNDKDSRVVICGGSIEAHGGRDGSAIGSGIGNRSSDDGFRYEIDASITVNNGRVLAWGGNYAAGIGCASSSRSFIRINGGYVEARGGYGCPGIGGGYICCHADIELRGGTIKAWGGDCSPCAIGRAEYTKAYLTRYSEAQVEANGGIDVDEIMEYGTSGDGTALTSEPEAPMPPEEDLDSMNRPANLIQKPGIGSTLSQGSWWIIGAGAVVIVGGVAALVIVNQKKKKAAAAKAETVEVNAENTEE